MNVYLNSISFVPPGERIPLPPTFDYDGYLDSERALNMLFPEVSGRRANFIQVGLTAAIYAEQPDTQTVEGSVTADRRNRRVPAGADRTRVVVTTS